MNSPRYTTWGRALHGCGHLHKTVETARQCIRKNQRDCERQCSGGYTDREVREVDDPSQLERYDVTRGPGRRIIHQEDTP